MIRRSRLMMVTVHDQRDDTGFVAHRLTMVVPGHVDEQGRPKHPWVRERENRPTLSLARTHDGSLDEGGIPTKGETCVWGLQSPFSVIRV